MSVEKVLFVCAPAFSLCDLKDQEVPTARVQKYNKHVLRMLGDRTINEDEPLPIVVLNPSGYDSVKTAQTLAGSFRFKIMSSGFQKLENIRAETAEETAKWLNKQLNQHGANGLQEAAIVVVDPISAVFLYRAYCKEVGLKPEGLAGIGFKNFPVCAYYVDHSHGEGSDMNYCLNYGGGID